MSGAYNVFPPRWFFSLLDTVPLEVVVGESVELTARNSKGQVVYVGLCPFHQEKTASFAVYPKIRYYHCFGCGANGNTIRFLMDTMSLDFSEAVQQLAKLAGMQIPWWEVRKLKQSRKNK